MWQCTAEQLHVWTTTMRYAACLLAVWHYTLITRCLRIPYRTAHAPPRTRWQSHSEANARLAGEAGFCLRIQLQLGSVALRNLGEYVDTLILWRHTSSWLVM